MTTFFTLLVLGLLWIGTLYMIRVAANNYMFGMYVLFIFLFTGVNICLLYIFANPLDRFLTHIIAIFKTVQFP